MIIVLSILIIVFVLLVVGGKIHLRGMHLFYTEEIMMYDELASMQPEHLAGIQRQNEAWMAQHKLEHEAFMAEIASWYNTCTALVVRDGVYEPTAALHMAIAHQIDMQMKDYYIERDMDDMEE